jgi:alkanesulfonate monooxygenase SsuD/methylene tetrahydromethanopterin reductase-like flavin-dependent oxidoreductase (luciferase family)
MMTNGVVCLSDRNRAREVAKRAGLGYLVTMVNLYHDTMPKSPDGRTWPDPPATVDFQMTDEVLDHLIAGGYMMCGTPDEVSEQLEMYSKVGCDQLVFGLPIESMYPDEVYEMLEVFGDKVIPEHDKNPEHSTTVYRRNAVRRYPEFNYPVQDFDIKVLPPNARIPL